MKPSFAQPKNISEDQTSNPKKKIFEPGYCAPPYHPTCSIASQWLPGNYHYHHLPNGLSTYFVANMLSCSVCLFHFSSSIWGETWSGVEFEIWMVIFSQMLFPRCWWCSNHCLRLHTCLKLPFSFMSPPLPLLCHTPENTKFFWCIGERWISKWITHSNTNFIELLFKMNFLKN